MKQDNITDQRVDRAWGKMETLLDKRMPEKKRRYPFWIFFLFGFGSLGSMALIYLYPQAPGTIDNKPQDTEQTEIIPLLKTDRDLAEAQIKDEAKHSNTNSTKTGALSSTQDDMNPSSEGKINSEDGSYELTDSQINRSTHSNSNSLQILSKGELILSDSPAPDETPIKVSVTKERILDTMNELSFSDKEFPAGETALLELDRIGSMSFEALCLSCDELALLALSPSQGIKPHKERLIALGIFAGIERLFDFDTYGYSVGLSASRPLNENWGLSIQLAYNWHSRNTDFDPSILGLSGPSNGADTENNLSVETKEFAEERASIFQGLNTDLSSLSFNLSLGYRISNRISVYAGPGIDLYTDRTGLEFRLVDNSGIQSGNWVLSNSPEWVSSLLTGVRFDLSKRLGLSLDYRYALKAYDETEFTRFDTDKLRFGLHYRI